ncbi:MAG: hypothetical protein ACYS0K_17610 [Planctomycetota bacterium]
MSHAPCLSRAPSRPTSAPASALEWLERAVGKGLRWPANAAPDPELAILKDDPRYEALRKKMASR